MAKKTTSNSVPGFFKSIPASIYSPEFYAGIAGRSFWKGFWYLLGVSFLIVVAIVFLFIVLPYMQNKEIVEKNINDLVYFYPEELVITIQDGKASSNIDEPYYFKLNDLITTENWSQSFKEVLEVGMKEELPFSADLNDMNLVVVDTKTPYSIEQFYQYESIAWLANDSLYLMSENKKIEIIPLIEAPDIVINKVLVDGGMETIWTSIKSVLPMIFVIGIALGFIVLVIFRMIYLLFFALCLFIACLIMKVPYDFGASYKIGFYAITLSSFLTIIFKIITPLSSVLIIPFFFTILSLIVAIVNLDRAKKIEGKKNIIIK